MTNTNHPFWQTIKTVPNFPKEGIEFYDVSPLFLDLNLLADTLIKVIPPNVLEDTDYICAIESRGFILASIIAQKLTKPMQIIRKKGKLPPPVFSHTYQLEYGSDTLEMACDVPSGKVLLVDDVLATGGTLQAAINLCQKADHLILGAVILLDLVDLHEDIGVPVFSVLKR